MGSLIFCEKAFDNEVWEPELYKGEIWKHVKKIISKIRTASDKLENIVEYHQSLGVIPESELEQKALELNEQQTQLSFPQDKRLLSVLTLQTSLLSTGLHLQNSLLK